MNKSSTKQQNNTRIIKGISSIAQASDLIYRAVHPTLGPEGGIVVFEKNDRLVDPNSFYITKDGDTILSKISSNNGNSINTGIKLMKAVVQKEKEQIGDGSTTFIIIIHFLLKEALKHIAAGHSPIQISKDLDLLSQQVCTNLEKMSYGIQTKNDLFCIASIASKSKELGYLIAELFEINKYNCPILTEESKSTYIEIENISGMQLDRGYINNIFVNTDNSWIRI